MFIVIICVTLIGFGLIVDFIAKKKGYQIDIEEGQRNASESERILKQTHLNQTINDFNQNL